MNYTNNYNLPQWVETDRIMMEDFNQMCSDIDEGIKTAQDTADTAESKADAAQTTANSVADAYTPDNQPYVTGSYTGTGAELTITLGFRPKFLIVSGMQSTAAGNSTDEWDRSFALCDGTILSKRLAFTDTGFIARAQGYPYDYYPHFTESGRVYSYIAFR